MKVDQPDKFCRHKYFESLPKYSIDQPSVNLSSKYIGDQMEIWRQEELLNKKTKWMTRRGFNTNTDGKGNMMGHKERYQDNYYVTVDASGKAWEPRTESKEKHLFGKFSLN